MEFGIFPIAKLRPSIYSAIVFFLECFSVVSVISKVQLSFEPFCLNSHHCQTSKYLQKFDIPFISATADLWTRSWLPAITSEWQTSGWNSPMVCGRLKRKRKSKVNCLTLEYGPKIRRIAIKELHWGVPNSYMTHLLDLSSTLPELFR
jgi:hypothetical protein